MKVLHFSHTDIRSDSRILKEMAAVSKCGGSVCGFGIESRMEGGGRHPDSCGDIYTVALFSRKLKYVPSAVRHIFSFFEFFFTVLLSALRYKPDLIHCNDVHMLPVAVVIKVLSSSRLVYDAHELESNKNGQGKVKRKLVYLIEKILWKYVDGLIVVSPSIEKWYINSFGYKPSEVILNSPELSGFDFCSSKDYLRERFNIDKGVKIFIYVGGLTQGRGIDLLVRSFINKSVKSSLIFMGYGDMYPYLHQLSEIHSNIHVHEAVKHDDVTSIVMSADVGLCMIENVSLSDYYCLPNKLFEYSFSGIPVLASDFPDISEIVRDYNLGLCVENSEQSIVEGIKKYERKSDFDEFLDKDIYSLSWSAQEDTLMGFYRKVLFESTE